MILIILRKSADSVATTVLEADGRDLGKRFGYRSSCLWSDNVSARAVPSLHHRVQFHRLGHRRSAVLVAAAARPVTCRGHAATPSFCIASVSSAYRFWCPASSRPTCLPIGHDPPLTATSLPRFSPCWHSRGSRAS